MIWLARSLSTDVYQFAILGNSVGAIWKLRAILGNRVVESRKVRYVGTTTIREKDMRYRKVIQEEFIDAIRWTGKNTDEIKELVGDEKKVRFDSGGRMYVGNFQTYIPVEVGEFVVMRDSKTDKGRQFITKWSQDMMDANYEPIDEELSSTSKSILQRSIENAVADLEGVVK